MSSPGKLLGVTWSGARGRLFLLVLLVIVPSLVVLLAGAYSDLRRDIAERQLQVLEVIGQAGSDYQSLLDQTRTAFVDLVLDNAMRRPDNCTQAYSALRLAYERLAPEATNIGLSDAQGNVYCAVQPMVGSVNIAKQPYFQAAVETLDLAAGVYRSDPITSAPSMNIAYPVLGFDGEVQTVIIITFGLEWLDRWQTQVALPPGASLTLFAPDGEILQRYLGGAAVSQGGNADRASWFTPLLSGQGVIESPDLDGIRRLNTVISLGQDTQKAAYLHLGYPVEELYNRAYSSLGWKLALLVLTLLFGLALAWFGSEQLFLRPLRSLMDVVRDVQAGDLSARTAGMRGLTELTHLADVFDHMTDSLQQREAARQQARHDLLESDERFRAVFENAAVGVAVMTLDRRIVQINQRATELTGYSPDEISQINPSMLAVEEDRYIDRHLFMELVEGKRDQYTAEKRYLHKDGHMFWGRVNFSAVRGADGKPLYTIGMIEDITEEKRAAEKLAAQEAEHRRMLEQRIIERTEELNKANQLLQQKAAQDAVAAERTRLARELHDAVTQTLFSATLIADVLPDLWEANITEGRRRLAELHQLTRGALAEMRALLVELRPNALVEVPLPTLLRQLTEAITGRARINVQLNVDGGRKLPDDVQVALYRITQEALNNIVKHSHATQAMVTLRLGETVRLTVADNGAGFDPDTVTADHLGLKIMRERSEAIGARLSVYSEPGEGAQISVVWQ